MPAQTPLKHRTRSQALATGDRVGLLGSLLCAVHCALLPLIVALLPTLGLGVTASIDFDQAFTVFATLLGVTTLAFGFRRHRAFRAWLALIPGLALIWLASFTSLHDHSIAHVTMMVSGGLAVAAAHLINLRLAHVSLLPQVLALDTAEGTQRGGSVSV